MHQCIVGFPYPPHLFSNIRVVHERIRIRFNLDEVWPLLLAISGVVHQLVRTLSKDSNTKHKQKQRFVAFSHPILTCMSHVRLSTNKNIENCLMLWCKLNWLYKDSIGAQKAYNCEHTCYRHSLVTEVDTMQLLIALLFVIAMFTLLCNVEGEELEQQKRYDW